MQQRSTRVAIQQSCLNESPRPKAGKSHRSSKPVAAGSRLNESPRPKAGKSKAEATYKLTMPKGLNESPRPKAGKSECPDPGT